MNSTRSSHKNQQKSHPAIKNTFYRVFKEIPNITEGYVTDALHNKLLDSDKAVLNYIIWQSRRFQVIIVSHARIASAIKYSRSCVKEAIERLKKLGLLITHYHHELTLSYHLPSIFKKNKPFALWSRILQVYAFFSLQFLYSTRGELLVSNNGVIYKQNKHNKQSGVSLTHVRAREGDVVLSCVVKKEKEDMNNHIPEYIRNIKSLKLTLAGQVDLLLFDKKAVLYADENFRYSKSIKDPFKFFCSIAHNYTKQNNLPLHRTKANFYRDSLKISETADKLECLPEVPQQRESAKSFSRATDDSEIQAKLVDQVRQESRKRNAEYLARLKAEGKKKPIIGGMIDLGRRIAEQTPKESMYATALKVERHYAEHCNRGTANPWLEKLSPMEQDQIIEMAWGESGLNTRHDKAMDKDSLWDDGQPIDQLEIYEAEDDGNLYDRW